MKKLFAILLAIAMIAALSVTAFAADNAAGSLQGGNEVAVFGKYIAAGTPIDVYEVVIEWDTMKFDYTDAQMIWSTEELDWVVDRAAAWSVASDSSNDITLTNKSSKDVVATFTWTASQNYTGITAAWTGLTDNKVTVLSALNNDGDAGVAEVEFMPAGKLADSVTILTQLGTITVAISDVPAQAE